MKNVKQVQNDNYFNEGKALNILTDQDEDDELDVKVEKDFNDLFWRESFFINGSNYNGTWDAVGMAGIGKYILPNG